MRHNYAWFEDRAAKIWRSAPGRSFLLVSPYGCNEAATAESIRRWTTDNFHLPEHSRNSTPTVVRITPDGVSSSVHFVRKFTQQLARATQRAFNIEEEYPSDILQATLDEAHAQNVYPILVIERFHAFASIADESLLSVLAGLRSLEHATMVTTLAISPIGYDTIRRRMAADLPFVNSAYGDNHDRAVMTPLSREEFVAEATLCGLKRDVSYRLFGLGGGPDIVFRTLIDSAIEGEENLIERCVQRLGDRLDSFLEYTFAEPGYDREEILTGIALGCLTPIQEEYVARHLLAAFLTRRTPQGRTISSTPILSRAILRGRGQRLNVFEDCLRAVSSGDYARARALLSSANPVTPHLQTFWGIVDILVCLCTESEAGLLGIDWRRIKSVGTALLRPDTSLGSHRSWIETLTRWAAIVEREAGAGRPQLDAFTVRAAERDIYELLLFSMWTYLKRVQRVGTPTALVRAVASLPESILQALAAAYCGIDFRKVPKHLPALDYDRFFNLPNGFRLPQPGSKMELTSLLVVVPAVLSGSTNLEHKPPALCDSERICPLQQKLVDRVRNPNAHTIANFSAKDADFVVGLCLEWLDSMAILAGYTNIGSTPALISQPTTEQLSILLYGGGEAQVS